MRVIEKTVFKFDELSDSAKERARDWYRQADCDDNSFAECVIEDAATVADLFGLDIRQTRKTRADGTTVYVPTVYFSGFSSQGDGACFEGSYQYKKGALKAVKAYAPLDAELHRIVSGLQAAQKRHFYMLEANCSQRGRYMHSGCMNVDVEHLSDSYRGIGGAETEIRDLLRSFADWIYKRLETEYEYKNADDQVDDSIRANEYEFSETGERA